MYFDIELVMTYFHISMIRMKSYGEKSSLFLSVTFPLRHILSHSLTAMICIVYWSQAWRQCLLMILRLVLLADFLAVYSNDPWELKSGNV